MPTLENLCTFTNVHYREYQVSELQRKVSRCGSPVVESVLVPVLGLASVLLSVVSLCATSWMNAYLTSGVHFVSMSPWYLCANPCPVGECETRETAGHGKGADIAVSHKEHMDCFWMKDWAGTGFGDLTVIQHLEYWGLGSIILASILSLARCLDTRGHLWIFHCGRAATVLLIVSTLLSFTAVLVFATAQHQGLEELVDSKPVHVTFSWPFYLRVCSTLSCVVASGCSLLHQWRTRHERPSCGEEEEDQAAIMSLNGEDVPVDWSDMGYRI